MTQFPFRAKKAMAILAHPDDEALLCFGTLALLKSLDVDIHILFITNGGQGRVEKTSEVLSLISATYSVLDYPASNLIHNLALMKSIENEIEAFKPNILITHSSANLQQQDHTIVSTAATLSARRSKYVKAILHSESPSRNDNFLPNFFVNISMFIDTKTQAVKLYQSILNSWYMNSQVVKTRATWWGLQVQNSEVDDLNLYEAFELKFFDLSNSSFLDKNEDT